MKKNKRFFLCGVLLFSLSFHLQAEEEKRSFFKALSDKIIKPKEEVEEKEPEIAHPDYYQKYKIQRGIVAKGSSNIKDEALEQALHISEVMLSKRDDIRKRLIENKVSIAIFTGEENYCDLPEAHDLKNVKTFDGRSYCDICGVGAVRVRPITSICEDNLLKTKDDPYYGTEDILTHEFAHSIHVLGMKSEEKKELTRLYKHAVDKNIFSINKKDERPYMILNEEEFFATLSAVWFGVHNPNSSSVSKGLLNREVIKIQHPEMYEFLKTIYPE